MVMEKVNGAENESSVRKQAEKRTKEDGESKLRRVVV